MSKKTGIQLGPDGDLHVANGSLSIGNTLYQNQSVLLKAQKGDIKEYPLMGIGIDDITNDDDIVDWKKKIREEFSKDGLKTDSITLDNTGEMLIKADY